MRDHRGRASHEYGREFRNVVAVRAFLDVIEIVQAHANDLAGIGNRLRVLDALERNARRSRRTLGDIRQRLEIAVTLRKHLAEIGRQLKVATAWQVDDLISFDNAEMRRAIQLESDNLHKVSNSVLGCSRWNFQAGETGIGRPNRRPRLAVPHNAKREFQFISGSSRFANGVEHGWVTDRRCSLPEVPVANQSDHRQYRRRHYSHDQHAVLSGRKRRKRPKNLQQKGLWHLQQALPRKTPALPPGVRN